MQTLRKKTSPLKYKNETTRFLGDGVSFKAKLIGILEVSEARGDRMCQEALSDLKMAIRAAGEHKQRITINIAIDGLRLRDEKTGDSLYHHPVHKISFIAQDMTDSRAFGYIFGSPDTGHRFFGIKTDKAASQVVIAMRDLFQVVFALKKKEIELAKQHLEKTCYPTSPLFSDSSGSSSKLQSVPHVSIKSALDSKAGNSVNESKGSGTAVADLVDLELELNSLQQGLNQMERITPSDPFGSKDDPFGDSFISYPSKPILPPPPSSGKERSSRTSESSSLFSPKTPHTGATTDTNGSDKKKDFSFSHDFNSSHEEPSSGDWFTSSAGNSIFEDPSHLPVGEPTTKDEKHEQTKQEILSQFDVFTELDPLGTGRSKPYIDRKHFFQELKNPPKKALNELLINTTQDQPLFNTNFSQVATSKSNGPPSQSGVFTIDPFGEDPFVKEDPFADSDFSKQDPFESELNNLDRSVVQSSLSKSPKILTLDKAPTLGVSPKTQSTFDVNFAKFGDITSRSRETLSESECAPEPPPRPTGAVVQIKPPPLPPKKQVNDLTAKPPPRPPYATDDLSPYDYIEKYETAPNSLDFVKGFEKSPPLPVPARKAKFDSDFGTAPERPKKCLNTTLSDEDYLTPISFSEKNKNVLLPPPQKSAKKETQIASSSDFDGLDITLSQLTLSGLNELAEKLKIPASQLSNMTLVQLTNFLSNFIKSSSNKSAAPVDTQSDVTKPNLQNGTDDFPLFQADFAANFNNSNDSVVETTYDRYAVFRELMQEEIKQTKIDSEPEEILDEREQLENSVNSNVNLDLNPLNDEPGNMHDRYAALREIVEIELKQSDLEKDEENQNQTSNNIDEIVEEEGDENIVNIEGTEDVEIVNIIDVENQINLESDNGKILSCISTSIMEYDEDIKIIAPLKSPIKSIMIKSPIHNAVTDIVQTNTHLMSGSLSDIISGSSPDFDHTASNLDVGTKPADVTGESWAIFDQATVSIESTKEKQAVQSEEGVSPWSSDSKEFGNSSPQEWRSKDSGSGTEQLSKRRRDHEGWWDTSAEPEAHYYPQNRRSTDSYDEEYYECYERPRRRRQQTNWQQHGRSTAGGHSSSSRDVSPWEEEPRRREVREVRGEPRTAYKHPRGQSFERHRDRRPTDSWDEDDDYEYEAEPSERFHWSERHGPRDTDRESRHSTGSKDHESDRRGEDWSEDRRHRRRRDPRERWCCPDWEQNKQHIRFSSGRYSNPEAPQGKWRDRKHDERYYSRESQESPWEDEYSNDSPHFTTVAKRNWKQRPSSASETDRKTGEIKPRHHLGTGSSDGERERRYKSSRRSRSRDSQYSEPTHRHKPDLGPPSRNIHRNKPHPHPKTVTNDFPETSTDLKLESNKKPSTLSRKKTKDSLKIEDTTAVTLPRKSANREKLIFENDFIGAIANPLSNLRVPAKSNLENDFETSEAESLNSHAAKCVKQQPLPSDREFKDRQRGSSLKESKLSPRYQQKSKSLFEDDFSPSEKSDQLFDDSSITSIKEEIDREEEDELSAKNFGDSTMNESKKKLTRNRLSGLRIDTTLKKSGSVNIFAREDDPFDDDFFCGEDVEDEDADLPRSTELRWTDDFDN